MQKDDIAFNLNAEIGPCGAIYLKNFKAFGPLGQTLPLSGINLFFGPNSCGKSSVFQAIHLFLDMLGGEHSNDRKFSTTVYKGQTHLPVIIGLSIRKASSQTSIHQTPIIFLKLVPSPDDRILPDSLHLSLGKFHSLTFRYREGKFHYERFDTEAKVLKNLLTKASQTDIGDINGSQLRQLSGAIEVTPFAFPVYPKLVVKHSGNLLISSRLGQTFEKVFGELLWRATDGINHLMNNLVHLPPIRKIPTREELIGISRMVGTNFFRDTESGVWKLLLRQDFRYGGFLKEVNLWLGKKGLGLGYELIHRSFDGELNPQEGSYLVVKDTSDSLMENVELDLTDIGVGISQVIPVLGTCCGHNDLWAFIEQPELHLHPKAQCELADVFIAKSKATMYVDEQFNGGNILFLETHSEHLVLRMLRRIRETQQRTLDTLRFLQILPEHLSVFYFERTMIGVHVHSIQVTQDGDFAQRWPEGFFPERSEELF